jgi:hypothetical protein
VKFFKKIFDFYIFTNIHVAFAASSLLAISLLEFGKKYSNDFLFFIFFGTLLAYHFIRVFENCTCQIKNIINYILKQTIDVILVGSIALFGTIYFGYSIGYSHLFILIIPTFITLWYAIPFFKYKEKNISLRNYPRIKIICVALVWAINTVLFPQQDNLLSFQVWIVFIQRFFIIMALIIPFDIRDMQVDSTSLKTLPQLIGIKLSKKVGVFFLIVFLLLSYINNASFNQVFIIELTVSIISFLLIVGGKKNQTKYYTSFWVEAVPIFWFLLYLWWI